MSLCSLSIELKTFPLKATWRFSILERLHNPQLFPHFEPSSYLQTLSSDNGAFREDMLVPKVMVIITGADCEGRIGFSSPCPATSLLRA